MLKFRSHRCSHPRPVCRWVLALLCGWSALAGLPSQTSLTRPQDAALCIQQFSEEASERGYDRATVAQEVAHWLTETAAIRRAFTPAERAMSRTALARLDLDLPERSTASPGRLRRAVTAGAVTALLVCGGAAPQVHGAALAQVQASCPVHHPSFPRFDTCPADSAPQPLPTLQEELAEKYGAIVGGDHRVEAQPKDPGILPPLPAADPEERLHRVKDSLERLKTHFRDFAEQGAAHIHSLTATPNGDQSGFMDLLDGFLLESKEAVAQLQTEVADILARVDSTRSGQDRAWISANLRLASLALASMQDSVETLVGEMKQGLGILQTIREQRLKAASAK